MSRPQNRRSSFEDCEASGMSRPREPWDEQTATGMVSVRDEEPGDSLIPCREERGSEELQSVDIQNR